MKKIILVLTILTVIMETAYSQQLPLFTQYRENAGYINPATINSDFFVSEHNLSFGSSYRTQWVGFEDSPKTQSFHGEYIFYDRRKVGLLSGGYIMNDNTDPMGMTGIYGRIGGIVSDDPLFGGFSLALNIGMVQYRVKTEELLIRDGNDVAVENNQAQWYPDVGFGAFYYKEMNRGNYFYTGISMPQAFGLDLNFQGLEEEFAVERIQHFYGLLGYYKTINDESFLEGSLWGKYAPNAPFHVDANIRYQLAGSFWIGTGLSTVGSFHLEAGIVLGYDLIGADNYNIKLGFGYDHTFAEYSNFFGDSFEVNISYTRNTFY